MNQLILFLIAGCAVAAASSYIGSIMVLKRMSLVGDALSHVALPGMAIAISLHLSPTLGAFVALAIAVLGIWYLERTSLSYTEALVGIFFTASLAIGVLITDEPELLEALFGSLEKLSSLEAIITVLASVTLILIARSIYKKMMLMVVSEELAEASGIDVRMTNLVYLLVVGTVVALGIRFVGTMLTGALVIVPAVAAKSITRGMNSYAWLSVCIGVLSALTGIIIATVNNWQVGPIVVLITVAIFVITYLFKKT